MSYPRVNTVQTGSVGTAADTAVSLKLPNAETETLPADQTGGTVNSIGATQRWRIKHIVASFSAAPAGPVLLTITDSEFTWEIDVTSALPLLNLDLQCAPGAEVDFTLAAVTGAVGHINVSAYSEG